VKDSAGVSTFPSLRSLSSETLWAYTDPRILSGKSGFG